MHSFHRLKTAAATLTVGLLLVVALAATAQAGGPPQGFSAQQWKAIEARGQAMNRYYHLGRYGPAAVASSAEKVRAQATDRFYHLGSYAVVAAPSSFQWPDAGIGAGAMLGTILVAGGLALTLRRRGRDEPSVPRST